MGTMVGRIWVAYQVELSKAFRQRMTYFGPALVLAVILIAPLMHPFRRDGVSDYDFIAFATPLALNLLGFVLLLIFGAAQVSGELGSRAIRTALVRPVLRHEYLLAKLLVTITYAGLLTIVAAASSWLLVLGFGEMRGISYGGEVIYTDRDMRHTYLLGMFLNVLPQCAAAAFAIMVSTFTRNTGAAVGVTLGAWLAADIVKHPLHISDFVFSTYTDASWIVFQERCDALATPWNSATMYWLAGTSVLSMMLCTAIAIAVFSRRNLSG